MSLGAQSKISNLYYADQADSGIGIDSYSVQSNFPISYTLNIYSNLMHPYLKGEEKLETMHL